MTGVIDSPLPKLPGFEKEENTVWMPSLVNMSQSDARERLESIGLVYEIGGTQASETIMEGYVLGQVDEQGNEIMPGAQVESGTLIRLIAVNTEKDEESWAPAGMVTGISPDRDSEIELDELITLKIASGSQQPGSGETQVPNITGMSEQEGLEKVKESGLFLEKEGLEYNQEVPKGQIFAQSPTEGAKGKKGDIIKVKISLGARLVQVMSVLNQEREEAASNLEEIGMIVTIQEEYNDSVEEGRVISQSVEPGIAEEGTEITITVSLGREPERPTQPRNPGTGRTPQGGGQPAGSAPTAGGQSAPASQNPPPVTNPPVQETQAPPAATQAPDPGRDSDFDRLQ